MCMCQVLCNAGYHMFNGYTLARKAELRRAWVPLADALLVSSTLLPHFWYADNAPSAGMHMRHVFWFQGSWSCHTCYQARTLEGLARCMDRAYCLPAWTGMPQ